MSFFEELKRRNVVRVGLAYVLIAWVLLQGADFFLDVISAPNWVIQALLGLAVIGLPAVLTFSWVYEMTPEGLKREHEVDRSQSITSDTGQKLNKVIIVFLVLVVGWLVFNEFFRDRQSGPRTVETRDTQTETAAQAAAETPEQNSNPSVAVLPFENMSSDAENEYFSDGLTETLLHMLAQLPDLQVAALTSSFAFKGKDASIPEIAAALGVAHILEGSVQKAGDRVRVTAQLVRAEDGFHVWSQNYTRPLEDIFAIQDEIANDVARALDESLLGGGKVLQGVDTADLTAFETYLKALEQQALFTYASLPVAEHLFKEALAADPGFVDAKLGLVRNQLMMLYTGILDLETTQAQSEPLLQQVMDADPDNPTARVLQLSIITWVDAELGAEQRKANIRQLRDTLPLVPTETLVRGTIAVQMFFALGQHEEAIALLEAGLILDPLSADLHAQKGNLLGELDRFDAALVSLMRADEIRPNDPNTLSDIGGVRERMGDLPGKLEWYRKASIADPNDHELAANIATHLYKLQLPEEGNRWADRVAAQAAQSDVGRRVAMERAYASSNFELATEMAQSMIRDRVSIRQGAYPGAVFTYYDLMTRAGRDQEGYDFLISVWPELTGYAKPPSNYNELLTLIVMARFQKVLLPDEEFGPIWATVSAYRLELAPSWDRFPGTHLTEAIMGNDLEQARRVLLEEVLPEPIAINPDRLLQLKQPLYASLTSDPEVQAAMAQRERDTEVIREEVREMLLQPEWGQ
jgi:TolB-like protein/Tfp pilus assembly protein PilF